MTGILIVNEFLQSNKFNEIHSWLMEAALKQDVIMSLKTNAELLIDIQQSHNDKLADFILFWDKDVKLARYLEELGYPVFNSSTAIEICDDKSLTHLTLMNSGIVMPRTMIAPMTFDNIGYTNYHFLDQVIEALGFPMVVKESFGSFGQQVYLVNNENELQQKVAQIAPKPMLFQQFIKSSFGRDIRLQVVGNEVVACMYRFTEQGDFRANITNGGSMKPYKPTKEQCDLAIRCCQIIGLDFAGVDILFGEQEEPILCEVNSNAHFKNIYDCTGVNAADIILEHIKSKVNKG
jgi:alpha-L-glutamate ligases, RimK family